MTNVSSGEYLEQMTFKDYSPNYSIPQNELKSTESSREPKRAAEVSQDMIYDKGSETIIGTNLRAFKDMETGQISYVQQVSKRVVGQKAFWKLYLGDFLSILGILESKQIDVLIYILENVSPSTNTFLGTYRKIAEGSGVSLETARRVMKKLQDNDFIRRIQNGAYAVSPKILMKGNEHKKSILLDYYYSAGQEEQKSDY